MRINKVRCAVCGKLTIEHGDGFRIPVTTCLLCYDKRIKQNKIDKETEKQKEKKRKDNLLVHVESFLKSV